MSESSLRGRLLAKVEQDPLGGCWLWSGYLTPGGYGRILVDGRASLAHRTAWSLFRGPIPADLCVCHRCDVPGCVNPDHLFLGTHTDNMADKIAKGRQGIVRGEALPYAKLRDKDLRDILRLYQHGLLQRQIGERYGVSQVRISQIVGRAAA